MRCVPLMLVCAALGACSESGPVAKGAGKTVALTTTSQPTPHANANGAPPANRAAAEVTQASAAAEPAVKLPAAMLGRWALAPGDCTSTRGDAKGLLVVAPQELRFYESRAVPTPDVQVDARSAAGTFHFTGEGQRWAKYEALQLQKTMLVRTESNPTASFTYARCS
jgi:hypothetical protein